MTDEQEPEMSAEEIERVRAEFDAATTDYYRAGLRLRDASWRLPLLPAGDLEGEYEEVGYTRTERMERAGGPPVVSSNGWQSMSEDGTACWLVVDGETYRMPDDVDWN